MNKWTRANFQPNRPLYEGKYVTASPAHIALSREAAREGMVLLKNSNKLLPLAKGSRIALFGKGSFDYVKGGGGSGDVTVSYVRNLYEGFRAHADEVEVYEPLSDFYRAYVEQQYREGAVAGMLVEPQPEEALVRSARDFADTAVIAISRFSGEGWDRSDVEFCDEENPWEPTVTMPQICGRVFPDGDFYLTQAERELIAQVKHLFDRIIVVLNVGGVIDTAWLKEDEQISSALLAWQGGMEGGLAAADLICGQASPSGKLPDTFAAHLEDYPSTAGFHESPYYVDYTEDIYVGYRYFETLPGAAEKVVYPFGFGLSYTEFDIRVESVEAKQQIRIVVEVTNTGTYAGKEVVQVYFSAPQGRLGKPARQLCAFAKTRELSPGEREELVLTVCCADLASYDDLGRIAESAYVLEKGTYQFYVGDSVREAVITDIVWELKEDVIVEQLSPRCVPHALAKRLCADGSYEELPQGKVLDPESGVLDKMEPGTDEAIAPAIPGRERYLCWEWVRPGAKVLLDVAEGRMTMDEFIAQLSDEELIHLLGGQPNRGVANTFGIGNLPQYGVPDIMTADGPAGVRINPECGVCTTAFPCATLLASTWNAELIEAVGRAGGEELKENNLSVWLTPAVNIHRNPLCGRNFEYYSEDPLLAGRLGGAMVRGIQSNRVAACVKHFACNNKETNRKKSDSRVSERALREIYLKVFEIIVKEADPWAIMSSYNIINGCRASENHDLLEGILREEWHFNGMVTTDWWTRGEHYREIRAGNDLKMATGFPERVCRAMEMGELTRADLERCAGRVLGLILKVD